MPDVGVLILLFVLGAIALTAEIFIPSQGVLTLAGLGFLIAGIVRTFQDVGHGAGTAAVFACLVFVPTLAFVSVKYWRRTRIGRMIAPPNPILTSADTSVPVEEINAMIGQTGNSLSPLRPVGICEFNGRRVSCIARFGMIESGVIVEGVGMTGANLSVVEKKV